MLLHVRVDTASLRNLTTRGGFNTTRLAKYIESLAKQTDTEINADIRVYITREIIGGVLVSAQIRARGDFNDPQVSDAYLARFWCSPWGSPTDPIGTYEHHDDQIVFTAYAVVGGEHCL